MAYLVWKSEKLMIKCRVEMPLRNLQKTIDRSIDIINTCVAVVYVRITLNYSKPPLIMQCIQDVPKLPSLKQAGGDGRKPKGILLQELDIHIDWLSKSIAEFAEQSTKALEGAAVFQELAETEVDIMPREEVFLISSFILNLRHAA